MFVIKNTTGHYISLQEVGIPGYVIGSLPLPMVWILDNPIYH